MIGAYKMKIRIRLMLLYFISHNVMAISFKEAVSHIIKHDSVEALILKAKAKEDEANSKGSWGDPVLKIAAKNYPEDNLKNDQSPMTGVEFAISQKIALTTKYSRVEEAMNAIAQAYKYEASDQRQTLTKALWEILILKRKIKEELFILNENILWISKILKISKKLYSTGKLSQQAILDIQIRKSEIESDLSNKLYERAQLEDNLSYLIGQEKIDDDSVPWDKLQHVSNSTANLKDFKQLSFEEKINEKK